LPEPLQQPFMGKQMLRVYKKFKNDELYMPAFSDRFSLRYVAFTMLFFGGNYSNAVFGAVTMFAGEDSILGE
jgi:hypothetical protein